MNESEPKTSKKLSTLPSVLLPVLRCVGIKFNTEVEFERLALRIVSGSVPLLLFVVQITVYYKFFYSKGLTYTGQCLFNFVVCLTLDTMIVWAHTKARQDPGYLNERYVEIYTD